MRRASVMGMLLLALLLAQPANAMSWFARAKSVFRGPDVRGTVLTEPQRLEASSLESEVWVFSTTLGKALYRVRFEASDLARASREVYPGASIQVTRSYAVVSDGIQVIIASEWSAKKPRDETQAEFLRTYRWQILAYGLRFSPDLLRKTFTGNEFVLQQIAEDLATLQKTISPIIEPKEITSTDIPVPDIPGPRP